jgi:P4 family phage/plasmid primase-like protien
MYENQDQSRKKQNRTIGRSESSGTVQSDETVLRDEFRPTREAWRLILKNKKQGVHLAYEVRQGAFFRYKDSEGVWNEYREEYIKSDIRDHVRRLRFGNDRKIGDKRYYRREVFKALKDLLTDEENEVRFDPGHNPDSNLINFKNGMYNVSEGKLRRHSKNYYSRIQIPHKYDPYAACPNWKKALADWVPDPETRSFLQEFVGYCLVPDNSHHKFLYLVGSGSNGKSTFLSVLEELFGSGNFEHIPLRKLTGQARFETRYLHGKLVNACADIEGDSIPRTGVLKKIVAQDQVRGEEKHGESFDFNCFSRLIFSANELPETDDNTDAFYRRMEIVKFPNKFGFGNREADVNFIQTLTGEMPGIVNWAVQGLHRLRKRGEFAPSDDMQRRKREYRRGNDSVRAFFEDRIEQDEGGDVPCETVHEAFREYCSEHSLSVTGKSEFLRRLEQEFNVERDTFSREICEEHGRFMCPDQACRQSEPADEVNRDMFKGIDLA